MVEQLKRTELYGVPNRRTIAAAMATAIRAGPWRCAVVVRSTRESERGTHMSTETKPKPVGGLDDLDKAAKEAAEQLGKATSHNAIWDKAAKALKPGLAAMAKAREDAEKETDLAEKLYESLAENYDSEVQHHLRRIRTAVDEQSTSLDSKRVRGRDRAVPCQGGCCGSEECRLTAAMPGSKMLRRRCLACPRASRSGRSRSWRWRLRSRCRQQASIGRGRRQARGSEKGDRRSEGSLLSLSTRPGCGQT